MAKSIGITLFVDCMEAVHISESPLSEVPHVIGGLPSQDLYYHNCYRYMMLPKKISGV